MDAFVIPKNKILVLLKHSWYFILNLGLALPVYAQGLENPVEANTFGELLQRLAKAIAIVGTPLVGIFIIWSGFLFVTARGNEQQIEKAKKTFFWTVVGAMLVVGAWAIATALEDLAKSF